MSAVRDPSINQSLSFSFENQVSSSADTGRSIMMRVGGFGGGGGGCGNSGGGGGGGGVATYVPVRGDHLSVWHHDGSLAFVVLEDDEDV